MKKRNQIIAAFLAATMIITPATSIFAKAAKDGNSSAESSYGEQAQQGLDNSFYDTGS